MNMTAVICVVCVILLSVQVLGKTDDFPSGHDEEEVHVYKKYARYPPYIYMYANSNGAGEEKEQYDMDDANLISKITSIPHRRNIMNKFNNNPYDLEPELGGEQPSDNYARKKKSSVSWLLAAAIRMCHKHPLDCLRQQKEIQENMDVKSMMETGR